jgi:hypothetical protein
MVTVTFRRECARGNNGGDVVLETSRRWYRLAAYFGTPPGSHIGVWRTRCDDLRGVNVRFGRRVAGPCLTVFVHTRPTRPRGAA